MIAELYASLCETELWNRARLHTYMSAGITPAGVALLCSPCESLADLIPCGDAPDDESPFDVGYTLPELDDAPWYDPAVPESKNFAGLLVLETRLSPAMDRRMVQNVGHGGTATRARFQARTLYVRGLLVGKTCCSVDYGMKWLQQALLGDVCGSGCSGCALTFFTCAPSDIDHSECLVLIDEDGGRTPYVRPDEDSEWQRGSDFIRQMLNVSLLNGPESLGQRGGGCGRCGCGSMVEVEFTLGIGNPWMYRVEELVIDAAELAGCDTETCRIVFDDSADCDPTNPCSPPGSDCSDDPDCGQFVVPPFGTLPLQQCGCVPLVTGRNCLSVPADTEWFDQALIIEVSAGSSALRNLTIRAWQNPAELECCGEGTEDYFEDCNACATLLVGYVPAGGVLRFDSQARRVTVECDNVERDASRNVATVEGMPFEWFEIGCHPVCLGVDVDCANTSEDATVSVWRVGREL